MKIYWQNQENISSSLHYSHDDQFKEIMYVNNFSIRKRINVFRFGKLFTFSRLNNIVQQNTQNPRLVRKNIFKIINSDESSNVVN